MAKKRTKKSKKTQKIYSVKVLTETGVDIINIFSQKEYWKYFFDIDKTTFISTKYNNSDFRKKSDKYLKEIDEMLKIE